MTSDPAQADSRPRAIRVADFTDDEIALALGFLRAMLAELYPGTPSMTWLEQLGLLPEGISSARCNSIWHYLCAKLERYGTDPRVLLAPEKPSAPGDRLNSTTAAIDSEEYVAAGEALLASLE
ncbi:hypothetical protein PYCC9005_004981 [Savitreella phatthalungensis]